jgi:hypothetical protein
VEEYRNNKSRVKSVAEKHIQTKAEPSAGELRRKARVMKVKRLKI